MKNLRIVREKNKLTHNGTTALTICTLNLTANAPLKKGCPTEPSTLGDYLKQARLYCCLTRLELGLELEVYESTIDKWERGLIKPNSKNKQKIIQFLGYDPMQKAITI